MKLGNENTLAEEFAAAPGNMETVFKSIHQDILRDMCGAAGILIFKERSVTRGGYRFLGSHRKRPTGKAN